MFAKENLLEVKTPNGSLTYWLDEDLKRLVEVRNIKDFSKNREVEVDIIDLRYLEKVKVKRNMVPVVDREFNGFFKIPALCRLVFSDALVLDIKVGEEALAKLKSIEKENLEAKSSPVPMHGQSEKGNSFALLKEKVSKDEVKPLKLEEEKKNLKIAIGLSVAVLITALLSTVFGLYVYMPDIIEKPQAHVIIGINALIFILVPLLIYKNKVTRIQERYRRQFMT